MPPVTQTHGRPTNWPLTAATAFVRHHGSITADWRFLLEAGPSRSSTWLDLDRPFYLYLTIGKAICWHPGARTQDANWQNWS